MYFTFVTQYLYWKSGYWQSTFSSTVPYFPPMLPLQIRSTTQPFLHDRPKWQFGSVGSFPISGRVHLWRLWFLGDLVWHYRIWPVSKITRGCYINSKNKYRNYLNVKLGHRRVRYEHKSQSFLKSEMLMFSRNSKGLSQTLVVNLRIKLSILMAPRSPV